MPWARNSRVADLLRFLLEHIDERGADDLALPLGVFDAVERARGTAPRHRHGPADVVVAAEQRHDFIGFARAHQAVVDEDAGELIADRFVDQHRRDRSNRRRPTGRR